MLSADFRLLVTKTFARCGNVLITKGDRYSGGKDYLGSFRRDAKINRILGLDMNRPEDRALYEIVKKVSRLRALCDIKYDEEGHVYDDINDSVVDIINYAILFLGLVSDPEEEKP